MVFDIGTESKVRPTLIMVCLNLENIAHLSSGMVIDIGAESKVGLIVVYSMSKSSHLDI